MSEYLIGDDIEFGYDLKIGDDKTNFQADDKVIVLFYNAEVDNNFCVHQAININEEKSIIQVHIDREVLKSIKVGKYILEVKLIRDDKVHTLNQEIVAAKESKVI